MIQVVTREWEMAKMFIYEVAQKKGIAHLDWADFESIADQHKPLVAVKVEDNKNIAELIKTAFSEIGKTENKPGNYIVVLSYMQNEEPIMFEMAEFNNSLSRFVDKSSGLKWDIVPVENMSCKRRITIFAFE